MVAQALQAGPAPAHPVIDLHAVHLEHELQQALLPLLAAPVVLGRARFPQSIQLICSTSALNALIWLPCSSRSNAVQSCAAQCARALALLCCGWAQSQLCRADTLFKPNVNPPPGLAAEHDHGCHQPGCRQTGLLYQPAHQSCSRHSAGPLVLTIHL